MKLKKLKLHSAVVLNVPQMKAVRGGYGDPTDWGYLPELEITCGQFGGRCWRCISFGVMKFTGSQLDYCRYGGIFG